MARARTVAVVGATGAVGQEMLRVLEQRDFPVGTLRPMASARSAGSRLAYRGREYEVEALEGADFTGVDVALFSIGAELAREHGPRAAGAGAVVVDNSTAFRMEPDVPLVVPEVNGELLASRPRIVANPNCCAVPLVVVLHALRRVAALRRVVVTTFQSVSGTGKDAMDELREQAGALLEGRESPPKVYPRPIAFNCLPHVDSFLGNGYTKEEMKITEESRKMLGQPDLMLSATCVRVPVFRAHSESVTIEFDRPVTPEQARGALRAARGVELREEPAGYPTPRDAEGGDLTLVGRVREDVSRAGGIVLWLTSDNLRKGAALNAVQIAESYL